MCLRHFGLYCNACFGIPFVSILCMCCSHFSWYCFISFTIFSAPVFPLIHWLFSLSSFVIPRRCLKNSSVLLLNVVPLFSSVPRLHFRRYCRYILPFYHAYLRTYLLTDLLHGIEPFLRS